MHLLVSGCLSNHLRLPAFPLHGPPLASPLLSSSQRSVLTVRCHPSGLSSVAPGRLARTAWDSAHFPALIIPACSAGTSPHHSGLFRPLLHLLLFFFFFYFFFFFFALFSVFLHSFPLQSEQLLHSPISRRSHHLFTSLSPALYRSACMTSAVCLCVNTRMHRESQSVPPGCRKAGVSQEMRGKRSLKELCLAAWDSLTVNSYCHFIMEAVKRLSWWILTVK